MKKYVIPGVLLILIGLFALANMMFHLPGVTFLCLLGIAFIIVRLISGKHDFMIPGSILFCLGLGLTVLHYFPGIGNFAGTAAIILMSIALGFLMMHLCEFKRIGNWPLIPAFILFVIAVLIFMLGDTAMRALIAPYEMYIFPGLLILLGIFFLLRALVKGTQHDAPTQTHSEPNAYDNVPPHAYYQPPQTGAQNTWQQPAQPQQPAAEPAPEMPTAGQPIITPAPEMPTAQQPENKEE